MNANSESSEPGHHGRPGSDSLVITNTNVGSASKLTLTYANGALTAVSGAVSINGNDATITEASIGNNYTANGNTITVDGGNYNGLQLQLNGAIMAATGASNLAAGNITSNGVLTLQIGANQNQTMSISISDMRSAALGVNALDLTSSQGAQSSITTIDSAISTVSSQNSALGAYQDRLQDTSDNLTTADQNLTSANSTLVNVDMASEMSQYTQDSILVQAATSMLAQANQEPQTVLKLLG